jgi:hypothetical protein
VNRDSGIGFPIHVKATAICFNKVMIRSAVPEVVVDTRSATPRREEKLALVERIIATPPFKNSERLVNFLVYVCRVEADGRSDQISEHQIGVTLFDRPATYVPSVDGIVRSHASRLRTRLDQYFETEGFDEPFRLSIPRGQYLPVYERRFVEPAQHLQVVPIPSAGQEQVPTDVTKPVEALVASARVNDSRHLWIVGVLLTLAFLGGLLVRDLPVSKFRSMVGMQSPSEVLWRSMFVSGRPTTLVVGDAGVNMFENYARREVTAEEYGSRSWLRDPLAQTPPGYSWVPIPARSYTPWFVVGFAARLARLSEVRDGQLRTISARELTLDSLKNDQLLLIGGPQYNPWEQLLSEDKNFQMVYDGQENSISILNKHPQPGESPVYKWRQNDSVGRSGYSIISFSKNLNGNGHILELEGSTAQGDEAAVEFLLDNSKVDPVLKKAMNGQGRLSQFEFVLQTSFVAGGNVDSHVVAFRMLP